MISSICLEPIRISTKNISGIKELSNGEIILLKAEPESVAATKPTTGWRRKRSEPKHRRKREKRVVETLVVVDDKLVARHSQTLEDVTQYILTVMNMVR